MRAFIGDTVVFDVATHFDLEAIDADALPTFRVYEENSDTQTTTGTCAKRDDANTVGVYRASIPIMAGVFNVGKTYNVVINGVVQTKSNNTTRTFRVEENYDASMFLFYKAGISTVTSQTNLTLIGAPSGVDYGSGHLVLIHETASNGEMAVATCKSYDSQTGVLSLEAAPNITIDAADLVSMIAIGEIPASVQQVGGPAVFKQLRNASDDVLTEVKETMTSTEQGVP